MNPFVKRAEPLEPAADPVEPMDLALEQAVIEPTFDPGQWEESRSEARGSLEQLLLNVAVLILVGALSLRAQRWIWRRIARRSRAAAGRR